MDPPEPAMMNRACWGVETVERRRGTVGSGDGGAAARRDGEWSACATQWGVETVECGVSQWGLGSEVRCGRWRGRVQQRASEAGDFIHSA
jgi:hypothetical protein